MMPWSFPRLKNPRYLVKCEKCTFSKKVGRAGILAGQKARQHKHAHPEHVVIVYESVLEYENQHEELVSVRQVLETAGLVDPKPPDVVPAELDKPPF